MSEALESDLLASVFSSAQVHNENKALSQEKILHAILFVRWSSVLGQVNQKRRTNKDSGMKLHATTKHQVFVTIYI